MIKNGMLDSEYPDLPSAEHFRRNYTTSGSSFRIFNLTRVQADEIMRYANDKGLEGSEQIQFADLDTYERGDLATSARQIQVEPDTFVLDLGSNSTSHAPLYESLGIL